MTTPSPGPLLSVRAALVLLIAVMVSLVAGILAYFAYGGIATAALMALHSGRSHQPQGSSGFAGAHEAR
jgi:hypothetical protein